MLPESVVRIDGLDASLLAELFEKRPDLKPLLEGFEETCEFLSNSTRSGYECESQEALVKRGASIGEHLQGRIGLFRATTLARATTATADAVEAINESRVLGFAHALRSVQETAAFAAYHAERVAIPTDATKLPEDYDARTRSTMLAGRFDWKRVLFDNRERLKLIEDYDESKKILDLAPPDAAANVMTMLEALGRRLRAFHGLARGIVLFDYSMLSDLCHPAAGSNSLFFWAEGDRVGVHLGERPQIRLAFAEMLLPCLCYSTDAVVRVAAELEELEDRLGKVVGGARN